MVFEDRTAQYGVRKIGHFMPKQYRVAEYIMYLDKHVYLFKCSPPIIIDITRALLLKYSAVRVLMSGGQIRVEFHGSDKYGIFHGQEPYKWDTYFYKESEVSGDRTLPMLKYVIRSFHRMGYEVIRPKEFAPSTGTLKKAADSLGTVFTSVQKSFADFGESISGAFRTAIAAEKDQDIIEAITQDKPIGIVPKEIKKSETGLVTLSTPNPIGNYMISSIDVSMTPFGYATTTPYIGPGAQNIEPVYHEGKKAKPKEEPKELKVKYSRKIRLE